MSFVLQRVTKSGLVLSQIDVDVLRIGRGTNAELRSENPVVSLEHALIESDPDGYLITDKGSITGTYVNRKPVESARLRKGDVIEIGELRIEVQLADRGRPLFLRVESMTGPKPLVVAEEAEEEPTKEIPRGGAVRAPQIDYAKAYKLGGPFLTRLAMIATVTIITLILAGEVIKPERQTLFMPGKVSSAHSRAKDTSGKLIGTNCSACHDPWKGVINVRCKECHEKYEHAVAENDAPACSSCHAEHRDQEKLAMLPVGRCINCHADLRAHIKSGTNVRDAVATIDSFGDKHPEFTIPNDPNTLRFNHRLHLSGQIRNAKGQRETLDCRTMCHNLVVTGDKADPKPIKFATDCQRCHKLTFSSDFPDAEAPHGGDPALTQLYVTQVLAGNRDVARRSQREMLAMLRGGGGATFRTDDRIIAAADHILKVRCSVCHEMGKTVTKPVMRTQWLKSRFTHTAHRNLECDSCHDQAKKSTKTAEVLMPSRDKCVACHGAKTVGSHSSCMSCHVYHGRSRDLLTKKGMGFTRANAMPPRKGGGRFGMLEVVLIAAIVILLLVLLVPLGAALYQRLRARDEARITERQPVVRRQSVRVPPLEPQARPAPTPPAPAPAPPPPPAADATVSAKKEKDKDTAPPSPQATELVQWYGMLLCTEGALEGKRFMIEEDGFYIGRDSTMSSVVIPDGRISKRHVRIVPRDGRAHAIDQDSLNGTYIGSTSNPRITDVQLKRGDKIILGDNVATFVYQI